MKKCQRAVLWQIRHCSAAKLHSLSTSKIYVKLCTRDRRFAKLFLRSLKPPQGPVEWGGAGEAPPEGGFEAGSLADRPKSSVLGRLTKPVRELRGPAGGLRPSPRPPGFLVTAGNRSGTATRPLDSALARWKSQRWMATVLPE